MIVIDTSALMAIILDEAQSAECMQSIGNAAQLLMSAGTMAESYIVAERKGVGMEMEEIISGLKLEIIPVTQNTVKNMVDA